MSDAGAREDSEVESDVTDEDKLEAMIASDADDDELVDEEEYQ